MFGKGTRAETTRHDAKEETTLTSTAIPVHPNPSEPPPSPYLGWLVQSQVPYQFSAGTIYIGSRL